MYLTTTKFHRKAEKKDVAKTKNEINDYSSQPMHIAFSQKKGKVQQYNEVVMRTSLQSES